MRALIPILVASQLAGCVSYQASKVVAITGGVALAGGIVLTAASENAPAGDHVAISSGDAAGVAFISLGLVLGITGLIGMAVHRRPAPTPTP